MIHARPRLRVLVLAAAALLVAAATAGISGATTKAGPTNTAAPTVSGTAAQGQSLTTTSGSWSGATPITFAYKWERCDAAGGTCAVIAGATAPDYTVASNDVDHTLRSLVTATNSGGSTSQESAATAKVTGSAAPSNTALPVISGTMSVGSTIATSKGTWNGTAPIGYQYQWRRCDTGGGSCANISGAIQQTYPIVNSDTGHTLRVTVTATNSGGSAQATSGPSALVQAGAPANTAKPAITGTTTQAQTLTVSNGTWTGTTPITYTYAWMLCDASGNNCAAISGETKATHALAATDVGHKLRAVVTAANGAGKNSVQTDPVGPVISNSTLPPGAVKLPNGEISVPAASIPDTNRLTISSVKYTPSAIHGRAPVTITVKVTDVNKYVISGALVYVLPVPSNFAAKTTETPTGQDGTVTITITPTAKAPKRGSLVLFVRARTPQGNLLAGSSTRRLVSVRIFAS